jgi:hypothetical protein
MANTQSNFKIYLPTFCEETGDLSLVFVTCLIFGEFVEFVAFVLDFLSTALHLVRPQHLMIHFLVANIWTSYFTPFVFWHSQCVAMIAI